MRQFSNELLQHSSCNSNSIFKLLCWTNTTEMRFVCRDVDFTGDNCGFSTSRSNIVWPCLQAFLINHAAWPNLPFSHEIRRSKAWGKFQLKTLLQRASRLFAVQQDGNTQHRLPITQQILIPEKLSTRLVKRILKRGYRSRQRFLVNSDFSSSSFVQSEVSISEKKENNGRETWTLLQQPNVCNEKKT